jgi:hypothetical protein
LKQNRGTRVQVPKVSKKKQVPALCWQNWPAGQLNADKTAALLAGDGRACASGRDHQCQCGECND